MAIKQFIALAWRSQRRLSSLHHDRQRGAFFSILPASHSQPVKPVTDGCSTSPLKQIVAQRGEIRQLASDASRKTEDIYGRNGISLLSLWRQKTHSVVPLSSKFLYHPVKNYKTVQVSPCFSRSFASSSKPPRQDTTKAGETKKDISTVDDPFDSPTYHIPEKPVSFTEGASYSLVILVGLGTAAAAAYAVFKELIFQPKEYKIYGKALQRVQDDSQVRVRIGSPVKGYGQESRNRAARQRISHRIWNDEDGVEHVEVEQKRHPVALVPSKVLYSCHIPSGIFKGSSIQQILCPEISFEVMKTASIKISSLNYLSGGTERHQPSSSD